MNKTDKKTVKLYLSRITDELTGCSWSIKKVFANDMRSKITDRFEEKEISYDSLCAEFGTPEEIAASFYDRDDYSALLKKSKLVNLILTVSVVVLIAIITLLSFYIAHLWSMVGGEITVDSPGITVIK
ncbi:MAG: hypothetical protein J6S14_11440 [Clostridia bacterium]|nr:hypothetical protein [Clostridia bacterium]